MDRSLSHLAKALISAFEKHQPANHERKIAVNPFVSKVASWYEKLRSAMDYQEEEVVLRVTIERILKRRLLLGGSAKSTSEPLIRELIWARYLPDEGVAQSSIGKVEESISLYLAFRHEVLKHRKVSEGIVNEWTYHLLSSEIEEILKPNPEEDNIANFMFQLLSKNVQISDDTEETRNAQVYIAVRKAFARDDIAFLRYHMFLQIFGRLTPNNLQDIALRFDSGYKEIIKQLEYPRKEKIHAYIKRNAPPFFILQDVFREKKGNIGAFIENSEDFKKAIFSACSRRYNSIANKVRRAIIRSVLFILLTKLIFAFLVEGTYERIVYGKVLWGSIALNTGIPPLLMVVVGFFIRTPGGENSKRIYSYIERILTEENPELGNPIVVKKAPDRSRPFLTAIFTILWLGAFFLSFGAIIYVLTKLDFSVVSQFIFLFFLAIVSFLTYRISTTAHMYDLGERQTIFTPIVDFLFLPVVRVGRHLTEGIAQINILLFLFDFLIETPFKELIAFFEQWFYFLHSKREELE